MNNCPFCGVENPQENCEWGDGYTIMGRLPGCYEREIATLKSDLALWKDFWDNMRHADKVIYENICTHTKRLKERGLI